MVSCCSGGDGCDLEQAGQSVFRSSVDHHPGCSSWVALTLLAHISTIQGNNPAYTITTEFLFPEAQIWQNSKLFNLYGKQETSMGVKPLKEKRNVNVYRYALLHSDFVSD